MARPKPEWHKVIDDGWVVLVYDVVWHLVVADHYAFPVIGVANESLANSNMWAQHLMDIGERTFHVAGGQDSAE